MGMAVVTFSAVPVGGGPTTELLPNGGFEKDADGDGVPDGWHFSWRFTHNNDRILGVEKQRPETRWDATTVHRGKHSLFVRNARSRDDGVWTRSGIRVPRGVKYFKLEAWIKTKDMNGAAARVAGVFLGERGRWLGADYDAITVNTDCDWTRYTGYLSLPPGTRRVRIRLWLNMRYAGTGSVWYDDLRLTPTDSIKFPRQRYEDDRPRPTWTPGQRKQGYVCFTRNYLRVMFPTSLPDSEEIDKPLACFASLGEREPLTFAVRALRALSGVRVTCSSLRTERGAILPSRRITIRSVRYGVKQGQSRWGMFHTDAMVVPLYLSTRNPVDIPADTTQQFWLTVHVPESASAGLYRGQVTVAPRNAPATHLPVQVEVVPLRLSAPPGIYFGMYHRPVGDDAFRAAAWRDMREHGMTTVGLCCNLGAVLALQGDHVTVRFTGTGDLERAVSEYRAAGFTMPLDWLMGADVLRWCRQQAKGDGDRFARYYRQVIEAVIAHGKQQHWPELIFQPVDEPFEHTKSLEAAEQCLRVLKSIPGVRTEEDGANGNPAALERLYPYCDILVYHDGPVLERGRSDAVGWRTFRQRLRAEGKEVWFYNVDLTGWHPEVLRFAYGFGLYQAGGTGMIEWSYQTAFRPLTPERVYTKHDTIIYQYPPVGNETGGPTLAWEAVREGVDDYKYLAALKQRVTDLSTRRARRAAEVQAVWREVQETLARIDFSGCTGSAAQGDWTGRKEVTPEGDKVVSGEYKMRNGFTFADYDLLRRRIADALTALR